MVVISLNKYEKANTQLESLTQTLDHIEVKGYTNIEDFKVDCEQTILKFERIIIFSNVFESPEDILDLNIFLLQNYNQVERVVIVTNVKEGKKVQSDFCGLEDLILLLDKPTVTIMKTVLYKSIAELKRSLATQCIENKIAQQENEKAKNEATIVKNKTVTEPVNSQGVQVESKEPPKKKGLFDNIFGKKKQVDKPLDTPNNTVTPSPIPTPPPTQPPIQTSIQTPPQEDEKVNPKTKEKSKKKSLFGGKKAKKITETQEQGTPQSIEEENIKEEKVESEEVLSEVEETNFISIDTNNITGDNIEDEDIANLIEDTTDLDDIFNEDKEDTEYKEDNIESELESENIEEDLISDIDFNDIGDEYTDVTTINTTIQQPQVKIVEKIVEVPTSKGKKGVGDYYNSVILGHRKLPIIITGDRRTGKTHTALTLASLMQKDMKVLFVDFDTERKGSLFYLGLDEILDAPEQVKHGIVLSKDNKDLKTKVWYASKGGFACLISMITQDEVTEEHKYRISKLLATQNDYGAIIIDCPFDQLKYLQEVIYEARVLICTETDLTACYNTLVSLDKLDISGFLKSKIYNNSVYTLKGDMKSSENFEANMKYYEYILGTNEDEMNWAKLRNVGPETNILNYIKQIV